MWGINCELPQCLDTMKHSKTIVNAKNKKGALKNPKLSELYMHLYGTIMDDNNSHTADYDVKITHMCCKKMKENSLDIVPPEII